MILPSPTAPLGSVTTLDRYSPSDFTPSDVILCRNVAPLVGFAFALLRRDVGCKVLGREIGKGLIQLIEKLKAIDLLELRWKVEHWQLHECAKANRRNTTTEFVNDKANCLLWAIDSVSSIQELKDKLERLFSDSGNGLLTLCTIHKSKGLEWEKVFILDRDLIPSKYAKQEWQLRQERNLLYVAITRAKLDLVYIRSGRWKQTI